MPELIIDPRTAYIGPGIEVKRILPFRTHRMVGPFIFMDHAGPIKGLGNETKNFNVLPHPHIGLSTVTYLFNGNLTHRDSLGMEQIIKPGEVNWMTAGKGISHSERFEDPELFKEGELEMIQTWVALPENVEETEPSFNNYNKNQLPVIEDKGIWMRLIAGSAYGLKSSVNIDSPLFYIHTILNKQKTLALPEGYSERGIYISKGSIEVNHKPFSEGQLLIFKQGDMPVISALKDSTLMLLGGEPLGYRYIWWNFVSSRKERIEQAKEDWRQGRILLPPNDNQEFVPLPEDNPSTPPSPQPLS